MNRYRFRGPLVLAVLVLVLLAAMTIAGGRTAPTHAQACPPRCPTPIITPAWHIHMCDEPYQEQLDDNHCMHGDGVTEFAAGTHQVYIIYCHRYEDLVVVQVKDSSGGLQYVNHPDGITYSGDACETLVFSRRNGIPPAGSPYFTSSYWPEGPFSGVSRGIEWFIGLFVAFDQDNYYGTAAEAVITARDPAANLDPTALDTITVRVTSNSDPVGIELTLREDAAGFPVFKSVLPLRFSTIASDPEAGVIRVTNRDTVTVSYCPRNCATPYTDTATWYQIVATITPTALPTWSGPPPTPTATPPPDVKVEYLTLRPAPDDVGYVPQISVNRDLPNHLGYPTIYSGMWTRGRNRHYGMVQFDLDALPEGATVLDARLELVGRDKDFTEPGEWSAQLLAPGIDSGWRTATFDDVHGAATLTQIGSALRDSDLREGRTNGFGFDAGQLVHLNDRLTTTRRASFRIDGPGGEDENLFGWHSGVDKYRREPEPPDPALGPSLHLGYALLGGVPSATPSSGQPSATSSASTPASATAGATDPSPTFAPTLTEVPGTGTATERPTVTARPSVSSTTTPLAPTQTVPPTGASPTDDPAGGTAAPTATDDVAPTGGPSPSATHTPETAATRSATPDGPATGRQVCLVAFDDYDGDGQRGTGERFLPGVVVRLTHDASGAFVTWTTDGTNDPDYCWSGLADGHYTLGVAQMPLGYVASGPDAFAFEVPFAGQGAHYAFGLRRPDVPTPTPEATERPPPPTPTLTPSITPTPTPQPTVVGPSGEICVAVYFDRDGDGFHGAEESWLGGVRVQLLDRAGVAVRELVTRDNGLVCARLATGVYYVRSALADGLVPSTTHEKAVLLTENLRYIIEFGQRRPGRGERALLPLAVR